MDWILGRGRLLGCFQLDSPLRPMISTTFHLRSQRDQEHLKHTLGTRPIVPKSRICEKESLKKKQRVTVTMALKVPVIGFAPEPFPLPFTCKHIPHVTLPANCGAFMATFF